MKSDYSWQGVLKKVMQFILFFGVGIFFVYLSLRNVSPADRLQIRESICEVKAFHSWVFLLLSFLIAIVADLLRSERNRLLLQPLGYTVRSSMAFYSVMVCYLANLVFPRLGEVLRCSFLQRYERVPFQQSLGTIVTERAVDCLFLLVIIATALIANSDLLYHVEIDSQGTLLGDQLLQFGTTLLHSPLTYGLAAALIAVGIIGWQLHKRNHKIALLQKIDHFLHGLWQGLLSIKGLHRPWLFLFYSVAIWVAYYLQTYVCFFAFDFLSNFTPTMIFFVFAIANLGFIIGPGGLGVYPLIVAGMLSLYGVSYHAGLAAGWVGWSVQTLMVLSVGTLSMVAVSFTQRKEKVTQ